jgi:trk system potassium uptake protein TrkH
MPEGYFGAADVVTPAGAAYAASLAAAVLLLGAAVVRLPRFAGLGVPVVLAANVGIFVPALVSDPVVAGIVIVWNLTVLVQTLFPAAEGGAPVGGGEDGGGEALEERLAPALRHLAVASLLLTVGVVGYRLSDRLLTQGVCLAVNYATLAAALPLLLRLRRQGVRWVYALAPPVAASLAAFASPAAMLTFLALAQAVLVALLLSRQQGTFEVLRSFYDRPSRLIVISFASLILVGTVLLTFPAASAGPGPVAPIDALFTATSAVCVTGLIVLDTPHDFSPLGQGFILGMIQIGGLGIMVLSTFATLLLGGSLGLRGERALTEMLDLETAPTAYRLTRFIVLATLAVEALGAVGLTAAFLAGGLGPGESVWRGVFHAVSAFCNAGFALQSDSLVDFQSAPATALLVAALIVLGGLGFAVMAALGSRLMRRESRPASTQVRAVLAVSAVLLALGFVLFAAFEWDGALAGMTVGDKLVNAFFQSVTTRTAGFNTVDLAALAPVTVAMMMVFMFIGASPGSTGGGVKTTTLAVLLAAIRSTARSHEPARLFGREVPHDVVYRSLAILVISGAVVTVGLMLLLVFEPQGFLELAFEAVSAFGTVGLSLGATAQLGPMGKLTIIAVMFLGRVGPLTLALLLGASGEHGVVFRYPQTRLMVG